jgi:nucleoside 2-deoxyribosyltransferase
MRGEELSYPVDHVNRISAEYKEWIEHYRAAPAYQLDAVKHDWRAPQVAEQIADEITVILKQLYWPSAQLDLFHDGQAHPVAEAIVLKQISDCPNWRIEQNVSGLPSEPRRTSVKRRVYLAAPFTSAETAFSPPSSPQIEIDGVVGGHGRIPPGPYRTTLVTIANVLRDQDFEVLLPHRDVNKWGEIQLSPDQVARSCTEHVSRCDVFVGVLGQSCGSHYEFGLALGLGKPCLILAPHDTSHSFVAQGLSSLSGAVLRTGQVMVLKSTTLGEAPSLLRREEAKEFLRRVTRIAE